MGTVIYKNINCKWFQKVGQSCFSLTILICSISINIFENIKCHIINMWSMEVFCKTDILPLILQNLNLDCRKISLKYKFCRTIYIQIFWVFDMFITVSGFVYVLAVTVPKQSLYSVPWKYLFLNLSKKMKD